MNILKVLTEKREIGNTGEKLAAKFLRKKGYRIREKNYVSPFGEIDIIAEKDGTLVFVEVKTRTIGKESAKESRPSAAVTPEKQKKIISSAKFYKGSIYEQYKLRLDIIEVYLPSDKKDKKSIKIMHFENAFNYNTAQEKRYERR